MGRCWRGFERWRSDVICLSNRLEGKARAPERGRGGEEREAVGRGLGEGRGGGKSAVWGMCGLADGKVTAMWVDGGGPGPVGRTGAGGWSDRAGGAFFPARATRTTAQAITG